MVDDEDDEPFYPPGCDVSIQMYAFMMHQLISWLTMSHTTFIQVLAFPIYGDVHINNYKMS